MDVYLDDPEECEEVIKSDDMPTLDEFLDTLIDEFEAEEAAAGVDIVGAYCGRMMRYSKPL